MIQTDHWILHQGWLSAATHSPSPNFNARPPGSAVDLLVIHNISLPPGQFGSSTIEEFFQNRLDFSSHPYFETLSGLEVSAHFLVRRDGTIVQFVSCDERAWHAGQSTFEGRTNCNDFSIGIELEGTDTTPFTDAQYQMLSRLTEALMAHYPGISRSRIVGHSDIAPGRKSDPGPAFDWVRYLAQLSCG